MRLASGVLSLVLLAPLARADEATTPPQADAVRGDAARSKIPLRVVRVMPESRQALLFDRARATHVLAEIGAKLGGYTVSDIDDDSVTLVRDGREVVLMAPSPGDRPIDRDALAPRSPDGAAPLARSSEAAASAGASAAPVDPYGDTAIRVAAAPGAPVPLAPAGASPGSEGGIRVVRAPSTGPIAPGEGGVRVASAPAPSGFTDAARANTEPAGSPRGEVPTAASGAPAAPIRAVSAAGIQPASAARADQPTLDAHALADVFASPHAGRCPQSTCEVANPATRPSEVRVTSAAPESSPRSVSLRDGAAGLRSDDRGAPVAIARGDLDRALTDFAALSAGIRARFSASGVIVDSVGDGTIFQRAGLRAGDVITTVDGQRLHTLDDAANLYARASAIKAMTVQIVRAGQPATLRVVIQ